MCHLPPNSTILYIPNGNVYGRVSNIRNPPSLLRSTWCSSRQQMSPKCQALSIFHLAHCSNGGWAVMRRQITEYSRFRVCNLSEQQAEGRELLQQPAALIRLASFLYEAYFQVGSPLHCLLPS